MMETTHCSETSVAASRNGQHFKKKKLEFLIKTFLENFSYRLEGRVSVGGKSRPF